MADTLFPQAAQLSASAAGGAIDLQGQKERANASSQGNLTATGTQASSERAAMQRQQQEQLARQKLEQLKDSEGRTTIDPEIAMGLAKNTGNPGYLQMVGHKIPTKALLGMYTNDIKMAHAKELEEGKNTRQDKSLAADSSKTDKNIKSREKIAGMKDSKTGGSRSGSKDTTEQKRKDAASLLVQIGKSTDDTAKSSMIANYNKYAEDTTLGLTAYKEDPGWFKSTLESIFKPSSPQDIVKNNHKEQPSSADSVAGKFGF